MSKGIEGRILSFKVRWHIANKAGDREEFGLSLGIWHKAINTCPKPRVDHDATKSLNQQIGSRRLQPT